MAAPTQPQLQHEAVLEIARRFALRYQGAPATGGEASFPAPLDPLLPRYFRPMWRVKFPEDCLVEVDDATGNVITYKNGDLQRWHGQDERPLDEVQFLSGDEILRRAWQALETTGDATDLVLDKNAQQSAIAPAKVGSTVRYLHFAHRFHGVPFGTQEVVVTLTPDKGQLLPITRHYPIAPPESDSVKISPGEAKQRAIEYLKANLPKYIGTGKGPDYHGLAAAISRRPGGYDGVSLHLIALETNNLWTSGKEQFRGSGKARLVWAARYMNGTDGLEIWIDAETGAVAGGTAFGLNLKS